MSQLSYPVSSDTTPRPTTASLSIGAWTSRNLFAGPVHIALTIAIAILAFYAAKFLADWAFLDATWVGGRRSDCTGGGACWAFVVNRFGQFVYGFYPPPQRWRVDLVMAALAGGIAALLLPWTPRKRLIAVTMLTASPLVDFWLLRGGLLGLAPVETDRWGGLMLTLVVGVTGVVGSFPLGIVLALGRRSELPAIRLMSAAFIELWRGVPLVTVLFMATVMLPFFLPHGVRFNELALALIGITVFAGAFLAEVIRGGLQAVPRGQYEAASALGLGYWQTTAMIVLPQALEKVIPGIVNNAIALFKDTTLVMIVGLFDILNIAAAGAADPLWLGSNAEGYVFVGLVFWLICFGLSRYSQAVERRLNADQRR
ncbi:MAG: amino acid ABC transporter permease [Proteobacteria bacterium]|nr:amino acid ABC transporter permease [Pseudomonadota bacterium]MBI3496378.1 amino acid ABC transporter permease [Pseudomonadota bacterium]